MTRGGGTGVDVLNGGSGNDTIVGGAGNDALTGSSGLDLFKFMTPDEGLDIVTDFLRGQDKIDVVGSAFGGMTQTTVAVEITTDVALHAGYHGTSTGPVFVFTSDTHTLYFDANGTSGPVDLDHPLAVLNGVTFLTQNDFHIS